MTTPATTVNAPSTKKQEYEQLRSQLENERASFINHWRECNDFIRPRRGRFFLQDVNKGDRRSTKIIDSTATLAARTLTSGMMSGVTSPARPWFRLTVSDPTLADDWQVKSWLHEVTARMNAVFLKSNLYQVLPMLYSDLGVFGTAAMLEEEDDEKVVRFTSFPIGSYTIACDDKGRVRTFMRTFQMKTHQIVDKFAKKPDGTIDTSILSEKVLTDWNGKRYDTWHGITHVISVNREYNPNKLAAKYFPFTDCYYEHGQNTGSDREKFLYEGGFHEYPVFVPRWDVTGEDEYATSCPGMEALGDIKQLQAGERKSLQAIDKMIDPPMVAGPGMRGQKLTLLPGHVSYVQESQHQTFRPAHDVNFDVEKMEGKQAQVRQRISRCFYEDLFLMLAMSDRRQVTAREIEEKHEEKLLALGPVLERLNQDGFDPMMDRTFNIMMRRGLLPPPPEVMEGQQFEVQYISIMHQAQQMVGLAGLERFASNVAAISEAHPEVADVVDFDEAVEEMATMTGIPPKLIRSKDQVAAIRKGRADAEAGVRAAENLKNVGAGAASLASADTSGKNALTDLFAGVATSPSPEVVQ